MSTSRRRVCSFPKCDGHHHENVSSFRFPTEPFRRSNWVNVVRRARKDVYWNPTKFSIVCDLHFPPDVILKGLGRHRAMCLRHAIPILDAGPESPEPLVPKIENECLEQSESTLEDYHMNPVKSFDLKENCFFCQDRVLKINVPESRHDSLLTRKWTLGYSESLCDLLNLDSVNCVPVLQKAAYCESCYELVCDAIFLKQSIQSLEERLTSVKTKAQLLIQNNYENCKIKQENYGSFSVLEQDNLYLESLKFIATQLEKNVDTDTYMEHESIQGEDEFPLEFGLESNDDPMVDPLEVDSNEPYDPNNTLDTPWPLIVKKSKRKRDYSRKIQPEPEDDNQEDGDDLIDPDGGQNNQAKPRYPFPIHQDHTYCRDKNKEYRIPTKKRKKKRIRVRPTKIPREAKIPDNRVRHKIATKRSKSTAGFGLDKAYMEQRLQEVYGTSNMADITDQIFPFTFDESGNQVTYTCPHCHKSFIKEPSCLAHIQSKHERPEDPLPFDCTQCPEKFQSLHNLGGHIIRCHEIINFECDLCQLKFPTWVEYRKHRVAHLSTALQRRCSKCNMRFTPEELQIHEALHSQRDNPFACVLCNEEFENSILLEAHAKEQHVRLHFPCPKKSEGCTEAFETRFSLVGHIRRVHEANPKFKCGICAFQACGSTQLRLHLVRHNTGKRFKCTWPNCGNSFRDSSGVKRHIQRHEGHRRTFSCHICQKKFTTKTALKDHVARHSDERPFLCDQCPHACKTMGNLWSHINITHRLRDYVINMYGGLGPLKDTLTPSKPRKTLANSNSNKTSQKLSRTNYSCSICGSSGALALDKAAGKFACVPCRAFYTVSIVRGTVEGNSCAFDGNCTLTRPLGRSYCKACRLKKCASLGLTLQLPMCGRSGTRTRLTFRRKPIKGGSCAGCGDIPGCGLSGINLCNPCYLFLVKSSRKEVPYRCENGGSCTITKENRRSCNFCRFKNCQSPSAGDVSRFLIPDAGHPCSVCGDRAYENSFGGSYGCAACRQFFKAAVESNIFEYSCDNNGKCEVTCETRRKCRGCRLAKCFQVGMKADRIGRYNTVAKAKENQTNLQETVS